MLGMFEVLLVFGYMNEVLTIYRKMLRVKPNLTLPIDTNEPQCSTLILKMTCTLLTEKSERCRKKRKGSSSHRKLISHTIEKVTQNKRTIMT